MLSMFYTVSEAARVLLCFIVSETDRVFVVVCYLCLIQFLRPIILFSVGVVFLLLLLLLLLDWA